jgi:hypothetical protein
MGCLRTKQGLKGIISQKPCVVCKLAEGSPVSPQVMKMMGYIETLYKLGCGLMDDLATDMILLSLPMRYELSYEFHGEHRG